MVFDDKKTGDCRENVISFLLAYYIPGGTCSSLFMQMTEEILIFSNAISCSWIYIFFGTVKPERLFQENLMRIAILPGRAGMRYSRKHTGCSGTGAALT